MHKAIAIYYNNYVNFNLYCFAFGRSRVKISALRPAILTEVFRGLPQSFLAHIGVVP
jgi:hypothetical protein